MACSTTRWMTATALSLFGGSSAFAQDSTSTTPPVPVFRPAAALVAPSVASTVADSTSKPVVRVNHTITSAEPSTGYSTPVPSYLLTPHFGYYPTQWRPFPGTLGTPGYEVPPAPLPPVSSILTPPYEQIGPPKTPPLPKVDPTLPVFPPMTFDPPLPKPSGEPALPKPMNIEPPKLKVPETPPSPPNPLLLDTPKPTPSKVPPTTSSTTGPALNSATEMPDRFTPPDLRDKLPPLPSIGFAEARVPPTTPTTAPKRLPELKPLVPEVPPLPPVVVKPVVAPPVVKASLGVPKMVEDDMQLPVIRSGIKIEEDTHRPNWPIIRNGTPK